MASAILIIALSAVSTACGQKGPLTLPDAQHPHKRIGVPKPPSTAAPATAAPAGPTPRAPAPDDPTATGEAKTDPAPQR